MSQPSHLPLRAGSRLSVFVGGASDPDVSAVAGKSKMRHRETVRIVPRRPITVAIQDGGAPFAYGVVANISEGGACIWTDVSLEPGHGVSLRLSFPRGSQPVDARGVVVWCEPGSDQPSRRYGLQWQDRSAARLARLRTIIATSAERG